MKRFVCLFAFSLCFQGFVVAAENVTVQDRVVGGAFKTMAKAYIAAADVRELKDNNVKRVERMREDWFRQKYQELKQSTSYFQKNAIKPEEAKNKGIKM